MAYNAHPDDQPPSEWRRFASDDEVQEALPEFTMKDPFVVAMTFCKGLADPDQYQAALRRLVTPESLPYWGGFEEAAEFHNSIPDAGYGSVANRAIGDDDVAYLKIISGVTEHYQVITDQIISGLAGVVTVVWRPEFAEWRVHAIGDYVLPESVPH